MSQRLAILEQRKYFCFNPFQVSMVDGETDERICYSLRCGSRVVMRICRGASVIALEDHPAVLSDSDTRNLLELPRCNRVVKRRGVASQRWCMRRQTGTCSDDGTCCRSQHSR